MQRVHPFLTKVGDCCGKPSYTPEGEYADVTGAAYTWSVATTKAIEVEDEWRGERNLRGECVTVEIDGQHVSINDRDLIVGADGPEYWRGRLAKHSPESVARRVLKILDELRTTGFWATWEHQRQKFNAILDKIAPLLPGGVLIHDQESREKGYNCCHLKLGKRLSGQLTMEGEFDDIWLFAGKPGGCFDIRHRWNSKGLRPKAVAKTIQKYL